jgi:hypothetical protein
LRGDTSLALVDVDLLVWQLPVDSDPPAVVELDEVGEAVAIDISGDERSRAAGGSRGDRGIPSPVTQGVADPVET